MSFESKHAVNICSHVSVLRLLLMKRCTKLHRCRRLLSLCQCPLHSLNLLFCFPRCQYLRVFIRQTCDPVCTMSLPCSVDVHLQFWDLAPLVLDVFLQSPAVFVLKWSSTGMVMIGSRLRSKVLSDGCDTRFALSLWVEWHSASINQTLSHGFDPNRISSSSFSMM